MDKLKLVSSNENKLKEFKRFGLTDISIEKGLDLKEVDGEALDVIVYKSKDAGKGTIVEDTSLVIDGAYIGVNVRWLLDNIHEYAGRKASWKVLIGLNDGKSIRLFRGKINGHISKTETELKGFGFDSLFVPEGSDKNLYELEQEGLKDEFSARRMAVNELVADNYSIAFALDSIPIWEGSYQNQ